MKKREISRWRSVLNGGNLEGGTTKDGSALRDCVKTVDGRECGSSAERTTPIATGSPLSRCLVSLLHLVAVLTFANILYGQSQIGVLHVLHAAQQLRSILGWHKCCFLGCLTPRCTSMDLQKKYSELRSRLDLTQTLYVYCKWKGRAVSCFCCEP